MVFKVFVSRYSRTSGLGVSSRYTTRKRDKSGGGTSSVLGATAKSLIGRRLSSSGFSSASAVGTMISCRKIVAVLSSSYMRVIVIIVALLLVGNSKKLLCKSCGVKNCFALSDEFVTNRTARELFISVGGVIFQNLKEIVNLVLKGLIRIVLKNDVIVLVDKLFQVDTVNVSERNFCYCPRVRANCYVNKVGLKGTPARIVTVACMGTRIPVHDCVINVCELLNRHCSSSYYNCYARLMGSISHNANCLSANCYVKSAGSNCYVQLDGYSPVLRH